MLLFFLRVGGSIDNLRWFIIALIIFNTTMMVAVFLTDMLQCIPIQKIFYSSMEGRCIDTVSFFVATAALTILTDILVMIIPTWITWNLQLRLRKKLAVIFLLSMGLVVTGISIYRMYFLIDVYFGTPGPDPTYSVGGTASSIEANLAIAAACGPFMKPLIVHIFPGFFGRDTTRRYYSYNDGPGSDVLGYYRGPGVSAYSASASASARRKHKGESFQSSGPPDSGFELHGQSGRSQQSDRRVDTTRSSTLAEDEEDDSSQRRMVATINAMHTSQELQESPGGSGSKRVMDGIIRETSVNISYSPKDSGENLY